MYVATLFQGAHLLIPVLKPIQVAEISSEQMDEDIEVVEELSMPPRARVASPPTLPGDITSTKKMIPTEWPNQPHVCIGSI